MKPIKHTSVSAAAICAALAFAQPAMAQSGNAASADDVTGDEIVVTARFKKETLQEVPQAISAFDE